MDVPSAPSLGYSSNNFSARIWSSEDEAESKSMNIDCQINQLWDAILFYKQPQGTGFSKQAEAL